MQKMVVFRRLTHKYPLSHQLSCLTRRHVSTGPMETDESKDPRMKELGRILKDDFASIRDKYDAPKHPIVLAHGLFGFDELRLFGSHFPGIQYWRGIREALSQNDIEVIMTSVPPSGSIESRASALAVDIAAKAHGKNINIIAHSMVSFNDGLSLIYTDLPRGLDSRYMISQLKPKNVTVESLTTIATPHRGSAFADYIFNKIDPSQLPLIETGAFSQLTRKYMIETFNPKTPDIEECRYFSYGASLEPRRWTLFDWPHRVIKRMEGAENDGLVSVPSSQWGEYKGTLVGVTHLDLINWTNRLAGMYSEITGTTRTYNGVAFYLHIADMLAKEGL